MTTIAIRNEYERQGVDAYYRAHGDDYVNPHAGVVRALIRYAHENWDLDTSRALDVACGGGEATLALRELGIEAVGGIDPYTDELYRRTTGLPAAAVSFQQIAAGKLSNRRYSLLICSFALHLCPTSRLPGVLYNLGRIARQLLVITPNKRPSISPESSWTLCEEILIERVRARLYRAVDF